MTEHRQTRKRRLEALGWEHISGWLRPEQIDTAAARLVKRWIEENKPLKDVTRAVKKKAIDQ